MQWFALHLYISIPLLPFAALCAKCNKKNKKIVAVVTLINLIIYSPYKFCREPGMTSLTRNQAWQLCQLSYQGVALRYLVNERAMLKLGLNIVYL